MINDELIKRLTSARTLAEKDQVVEFVHTGSYALNRIVSGRLNGGWPIGYISEIMGDSSTGKTVFLTHAFAEAQKKGWYTVLLDNEFAYNAEFAKIFGVDSGKLIYDDPDTVPKCFAKMEEIILEIREKDKETPIFVGLDSMAGQSDKEASKDINEFDNMDGAVRAKEIGQCLRHINPILKKNRVGLVLINQVRLKPGVMYGNPETRSGGGKSLEYYCAGTYKVVSNKTSDLIKEGDDPIGIKGTIRNTKNKLAIPFKECDFKLIYNTGLDPLYGILPALVAEGILTKSGAWYTHISSGKKFQEADFNEGNFIIPELSNLGINPV